MSDASRSRKLRTVARETGTVRASPYTVEAYGLVARREAEHCPYGTQTTADESNSDCRGPEPFPLTAGLPILHQFSSASSRCR